MPSEGDGEEALAELQPQAKRPGLPEAEGNALEAGAHRRINGIMRDATGVQWEGLHGRGAVRDQSVFRIWRIGGLHRW